MDLRQPYRYEDSREFYNDYYDEQVGNGFGVYGGRSIVPASGMAGAGFGSVLAKLARKALPYAKVVGKRLLSSTAGLAEDLLDGESFATSAKQRLEEAGRGIVSDFSRKKRPANPMRKGRRKTKKRRANAPAADVFG